MTQLIFRDNTSIVQENCPGGKPKQEWYLIRQMIKTNIK